MSKEILKSELNLFLKSYYQNSEQDCFFTPFHPISAITTTNNLEFYIPANSEYFIDPENIFLWIECQLVKQDDSNYGASQNNRFSMINYSLNTMWNQIEISLNNTIITQSSNTFPYTSYINMLTKYDNKSKHTFLRSAGMYKFKKLDISNFFIL